MASKFVKKEKSGGKALKDASASLASPPCSAPASPVAHVLSALLPAVGGIACSEWVACTPAAAAAAAAAAVPRRAMSLARRSASSLASARAVATAKALTKKGSHGVESGPPHVIDGPLSTTCSRPCAFVAALPLSAEGPSAPLSAPWHWVALSISIDRCCSWR
eukprot:scaffold113004_cov32-Tisochrysis_lutea.AAC.2